VRLTTVPSDGTIPPIPGASLGLIVPVRSGGSAFFHGLFPFRLTRV
jgi:hypothetical protein